MSAMPAAPGRTGGDEGSRKESLPARALRALVTQRLVLLVTLLVGLLVVMKLLENGGYLVAPYSSDYLAASLIDAVALGMLALAELVVIVSGRGGIDLSVGSMVSLSGMVFGFAIGEWGWPLLPAVLFAVLAGGALGAINGFFVSALGFPPLITTLATYYAYSSIALVINSSSPISTPAIQELTWLTQTVELPLFGQYVPDFPMGLFLFAIPIVVLLWLNVTRGTFGRQLYAIGTNDTAARYAGVPVGSVRFRAYLTSGLICGLVAVVTVSQFASARPDAGTTGNGMALPAITIAVLGGVAITGGVGRVIGVVVATVLVVWLNAGILLSFEGSEGSQYQLLALGGVLIFAAILNGFATRRYGGTS
ncbi:ABC transporter permease [Qaidamihabitans albus]|uniref:ABC transporter permease n=1 Tax=Qaidamihabitans albus TaxID=2795733 RepID=UPI0018F12D0D|nr:ABC transporter permease [Qaidamihabitans albus]